MRRHAVLAVLLAAAPRAQAALPRVTLEAAPATASAGSKGFAITFHVDDYSRYVARLKDRGVTPFKTEDGGEFGKFAYFSDPENNTMAIWGK